MEPSATQFLPALQLRSTPGEPDKVDQLVRPSATEISVTPCSMMDSRNSSKSSLVLWWKRAEWHSWVRWDPVGNHGDVERL